MSTANTASVAGDVVQMLSGTYGTAPNPTNSGNSVNPITYIGNPADPSAVVVPSIIVNGHDYIQYRYFSCITGNAAGMRLDGQSDGTRIAGCIVRGDFMLGGFNQSELESCTVLPPIVAGALAHNYFVFGGQACPLNGGGEISGTKVNYNYIYLRAEAGHQYCSSADPIFKIWGLPTNGLIWTRNKVIVVFGPGADDSKRGAYVANSRWGNWTDNSWEFYDSTAAPSKAKLVLRHRDVWNNNVMTRDSIITHNCHGPTYFSTDGGPVKCDPIDCPTVATTGCCGRDSLGWNTYQDSYYRFDGGPGINFQIGFNNDVFRRNVVVRNGNETDDNGGGAPLRVGSIDGDANITYNTFAAFNTTDEPCINHSSSVWKSGNVVNIKNNIFWRSFSTFTGGASAVRYVLFSGRTYDFNNNLMFYRAGSAFQIHEQHNCPSCTGDAQVSLATYTAATGQEAAGKYGSPRFVDSTFANFNGHLGAGSAAIGMGTGGTDAGAYQSGGGSNDVTPPAAITTLGYNSVISGGTATATLNWYSVGDDDLTGTATSYDIRWSTSPLNSGNFSTGNAVSSPPTPLVAGTLQTKAVTGLPLNTTIYFAIKAVDEAPNTGAISNVITAHQPSAPLAQGNMVCQ
jgi:hypothetical protein